MTTAARIGNTEFSHPSDREVRVTRVVDAPRALVWDAHTRPEHVSQWMLGPDGWTMPVCEIDLRPGGRWRWVWRKGKDGEEMEMTGEYREVDAPRRLVNTENWGDDWPESLTTLELAESDGRTTMETTVLYPSKEARDRAVATGMFEGWSQSYDRLDRHLRSVG